MALNCSCAAQYSVVILVLLNLITLSVIYSNYFIQIQGNSEFFLTDNCFEKEKKKLKMLSTFLNDFYKLLLKKYITFIFLWGKELVFDRFLIEKLVSIEITIKLHSVTHRSFNLYMYNTHTYVQDNRVSECTFWCPSSTVEKKNHYFSVLSGTARKKSLECIYRITGCQNIIRNRIASHQF